MTRDQIGKPLVYLPADAKLNFNNRPGNEIKTEYEKRRSVFDIEKVKEIVKGNYGSSEESVTKSNT